MVADGPSVRLREATEADATAVQRVASAAWHAAHDDIVGPDAVDELLDQWYDLDSLTESIARDGESMVLAVDRGTVVGFA